MKWIGAVAGILLTVAAALYVLLFTPFGNGIVMPVIQKKIDRALPLEATLETFSLTSDTFALTLVLGHDNRIEAVGNYDLFSRRFNAGYRVRLNDLAALRPLTQQALYGKFHAQGKAEGTPDELHISGVGDLAGGTTKYALDLTALQLTAVKAQMRDTKFAALLALAGKKPYASADISLDLDLKGIDPKALDGDVLLTLSGGHVDTALMKSDFNLSLPPADFTLEALAKLKGTKIGYTATFDSTLARIASKGDIAPQTLEADLSYEINAKELALFRPLTNAPLRGPFMTAGTVKGNEKKMHIVGSSDIAESRTSYDISLASFQPQRVVAKVTGAKVEKLLYMGGEPRYATGSLDADVMLESLDFDNLKGHADISVSKGRLLSETFKKVYGLTLPKTVFGYDLNARLEGKEVGFTTLFSSNLATLGANGSIMPKNMGTDLRYHVDIERLELLKPLTDLPLRGPLALSGTAKGDEKSLLLKGKSDLAKSRTTFSVQFADLAPQGIKAAVKGLQLGEALYMAGEPHYADGVLDIDADITGTAAGAFKGTVRSSLSKGVLDAKVVAKAFALNPMPRTTFSAKSLSTLEGKVVDTQADIVSSVAKLTVKKARYDLDKALLTSDYTAEIPDLDKLFFLTERHLKGALTVTGTLTKGTDLNLTAHSETLGGTLDATVHNDDVHADLKGIKTLEALDMLLYPAVFASSLDGTLDYNTKRQKGLFNATLGEGRFTQNTMLDLLKQLARFDLYKESFTATLKSAINKERILSDLDMRSRKSSITGKGIALNTKTQQVDAKLDVVANTHRVGVTLKGNVHKPSVKVDAKDVIKKEAEKAVEKELNRLLKKLF